MHRRRSHCRGAPLSLLARIDDARKKIFKRRRNLQRFLRGVRIHYTSRMGASSMHLKATARMWTAALISASMLIPYTGCGVAPVPPDADMDSNRGRTPLVSTFVDLSVAIQLGAMWAADPTRTFAITQPPQHGQLGALVPDGNGTADVDYTPDPTYAGSDYFVYAAHSGKSFKSVRVDIAVLPPVEFSLDVLTGPAPLTVHARAVTASGHDLPAGTYRWQFGDVVQEGPVESHASATQTFTQPGIYRVTLAIALTGMTQFVGCKRAEDKAPSATVNVTQPTTAEAGMSVSPSGGFGSSGVAGGPFSPASITYRISNSGDAELSWRIDHSQSWVSLSVAEGQLAPGAGTEVIVSFSPAANVLAPGIYEDKLSFVAVHGSGSTTRDVALNVLPAAGALSVSPTGGLNSSGATGGPFNPSSVTYALKNTGGTSISWTAGKSAAWLTLSNTSGTLAGGESTSVTASIHASANALAAGAYRDTVTFSNQTNGAGNTSRDVTLNVLIPGSLAVSPATSLDSSGLVGGPFSPTSQPYTLTNTGEAPISWTASTGQSWLTLAPASGTLNAGASTTVTATINSAANSLAAGNYSDTLTFSNSTNGNGSTTRGATLNVVAPGGMLVTPGSSLISSGNVGGPFSPALKVYTLTNTGGASISWTAAKTQNWLTLSSAGGTLIGGGTANVIVSINSNANGLSAGNYADTVSFTNTTNGTGNATRSVTLAITAPGALAVSPSTDFMSSGPATGPFSPASADYVLTNTGGVAINWTAAKSQAWVTLTQSSGTLAGGASTTVTVSIGSGANALGQGSYNDTVAFTNVTNGTGNTSRGASLTVLGGPQMASSVSQYGITWTFDHAYQVGQFVTGDWWVCPDASGATVTISSVSPAPSGSGPQSVYFSNALWTESTKAISGTGKFADYTHTPGNTCEILAGQGATPGTYMIASKISDNEIRLTTSIGAGADGISNMSGNALNASHAINGSCVNPIANTDKQPYDGRDYSSSGSNYDGSTRASFPLSMVAGSSLVSTVSRPDGDGNRTNLIGESYSLAKTKLLDAAVLTCLGSAPASMAFRPPFCGANKPLYYVSQLRTNLLPTLTPPTYANIHAFGFFSAGVYQTSDSPGKAYTRFFTRPWLSHVMGDTGENIRPLNNCPGYYRPCHVIESEAALLLCCDPGASTYFGEPGGGKMDLLYAFVQHGIDDYYCIQTNPNPVIRGDRCLSKWPCVFAGLMLNDSHMQSGLNYEWFKTDRCTYSGSGWSNPTYKPVGATALWRIDNTPGDTHETIDPFTTGWCGLDGGGGRFWRDESYRRSTHSWTWIGAALAARLMHAVDVWDHQPFFDYCDRWMNESEAEYWTALETIAAGNPCGDGNYNGNYRQGTLPGMQFVHDMWMQYR